MAAEAMAAGVPVVVTERRCAPEVVGPTTPGWRASSTVSSPASCARPSARWARSRRARRRPGPTPLGGAGALPPAAARGRTAPDLGILREPGRVGRRPPGWRAASPVLLAALEQQSTGTFEVVLVW
ncbi:hypothetical protein QJS66_07590 [Kocuria rhizophila]|nr:hypothetical protein QJS66_07590 [Kocuria rhizophila]